MKIPFIIETSVVWTLLPANMDVVTQETSAIKNVHELMERVSDFQEKKDFLSSGRTYEALIRHFNEHFSLTERQSALLSEELAVVRNGGATVMEKCDHWPPAFSSPDAEKKLPVDEHVQKSLNAFLHMAQDTLVNTAGQMKVHHSFPSGLKKHRL
ncbi:hypothetical protein V6L78_07380 [Pseudomonas canadensis]|uniref:hypothetical protein n=1 Tax=Pseudomonas canadensis TaxID=915099 RepID=UPI0030CB4AA2